MSATDTTLVSCCVCCQEIPLAVALTPEGAEYVGHFCGLECLQRFKARAEGDATAPSAEGGEADQVEARRQP